MTFKLNNLLLILSLLWVACCDDEINEQSIEQRPQFGLKTGGRGSRFKNWGLWVLKVQQTENSSTGLKVSFPEFKFNMHVHKSFYLWKSHQFRKCFNIIFLYVLRFDNISWRPHIPKSGRIATPSPRIDTYVYVFESTRYYTGKF